MSVFDEFDKQFDLAGITEDMKAAGDRTPSYENVPYGEYVVKVESCELKMTKKTNKPMISTWFRVVEGPQKGHIIFSNRVLIPKDPSKTGAVLAMAKEFLESLDTGVDCSFESFAQYEQVCLDVAEAAEGLEYHINYYENNKGFEVIEVKEVFEN